MLIFEEVVFMDKEALKKLSDIKHSIDFIWDDLASQLVDLGVIYELEYQIKILNSRIEKSNNVQSFQNWIMIFLTLAILYLTYVMAFKS